MSCSEPPRAISVLLGDPRLPDTTKRDGRFNDEDYDTINRLKTALLALREFSFQYHDEHSNLLVSLAADPPDFVFNLCDEGFRNAGALEAHVPALLEVLGIPYSGAGPACLTACYDKSLVRAVADSVGVPVPDELVLWPDDPVHSVPIRFPAFVKPNRGDGSVGIPRDAYVCSQEELVARVAQLRRAQPGELVLVQEFLSGIELTISVVGNPDFDFRFLQPLEVDYSCLEPSLVRFLPWESKWDPSSPYWTDVRFRSAALPVAQRESIEKCCARLFRRLGCRDYARFDFRADTAGEFRLLEVNPNPGWCWDGKLNLAAECSGISYSGLLRMILQSALLRYQHTPTSLRCVSRDLLPT